MDTRGWIVLTDGVSSVNFWRWSVVEHYTLERWLEFMRVAFPLAKGYAIGSKLFSVPTASELLEWGDRRIGSELDALCDSLARLPGKEVHVFVKDNEDLRREKYAAQQAAKAPKKDETAAVASASASAAAGKGDNNKKGGNNNSGKGGNNNSNKAAAKEEPATIGHLDIRVGVVLSAAPHPDGDTLYVEQIDVGEAKPRTIVSGIKEHIPLDKFVGSRVLVMCNLKAKPLRGVESNGMIVCGSRVLDEEKKTKLVRLLEVPEAKPGSKVVWTGEAAVTPDEQVSASKLGKLLANLKTDDKGNVVFGAFQATVGGHVVTCKEIPNGVVG